MYKDADKLCLEKGENGIVMLHVCLGMFNLFQVLYFVKYAIFSFVHPVGFVIWGVETQTVNFDLLYM